MIDPREQYVPVETPEELRQLPIGTPLRVTQYIPAYARHDFDPAPLFHGTLYEYGNTAVFFLMVTDDMACEESPGIEGSVIRVAVPGALGAEDTDNRVCRVVMP